jgi:hypothetical protein
MPESVWSDGMFYSCCAISEENDVARGYFVVLLLLRLSKDSMKLLKCSPA